MAVGVGLTIGVDVDVGVVTGVSVSILACSSLVGNESVSAGDSFVAHPAEKSTAATTIAYLNI